MSDTDAQAASVKLLIQQGVQMYQAGNLPRAAKLLYHATQTDPDNQIAWLWLAASLDDVEDKRKCLERARSIDPASDAGMRAAQALTTLPPPVNANATIPLPDFPMAPPAPMPATSGNGHRRAATPPPVSPVRPAYQPHAQSSPAGETVLFKGQHHWSILVMPTVSMVLFFLIGLVAMAMGNGWWLLSLILWVFGLLPFIGRFVKYLTTEITVTSQRITRTSGLLNRTSLEVLLSKVESIAIQQKLTERLFGSGTVAVIGSGGTVNRFEHMANATRIRQMVQEQVAQAQGRAI